MGNTAIHLARTWEHPLPLPIIPGVNRVSMVGHMGLQTIVNVLHMSAAGGTSQNDVGNDAGIAWKTMYATGASDFSNEIHWDHVTVQPLDGTTPSLDVLPTGWPFTGLSSAIASVPAQVAMICTIKTAFSGRSNRGRMFLAGVTANSIDATGTLWTPAAVTAIGARTGTFAGTLNGTGTHGVLLGVASYVHSSFHGWSAVICRPYIGTQRRRVD